jgi:hypothetical protein
VLLACLLGGLSFLSPQSLRADDLKGALDRGGFQNGERRQIEELFDQASAQGIPEGILLPRLQEGVAKAATAERLLAALARERDLLLQARELLLGTEGGAQQMEDPASWARTANLLNIGLPAEQLGVLILASAPRPADYRPASYLYVALLQWGIGPEAALALVRAALSSSLPGRDFPGLVDLLTEGRMRRIPVEQTLEQLARELPRAAGLQALRRRLY